MATILVLHGPNLNLLGQRQPEIYGHDTLAEVEANCALACAPGFDVKLLQANWEGQVIDWILEARHAAWADRVVFLRDGRTVDDTGRAAEAESLLEVGR